MQIWWVLFVLVQAAIVDTDAGMPSVDLERSEHEEQNIDSRPVIKERRSARLDSIRLLPTTFFQWVSQPFRSQTKRSNANEQRLTLRVYYSAIVPTMLEFIYGASILSMQAISEHSMDRYKISEDSFLSLCCSVLFFGAVVSLVLFYLFQSSFRRAFIITSLSYALGLLCSGFYESLPLIIVGRFLIGFSAGIIVSYLPTYLYEISPPFARPFFSTLNVAGFAFGILSFYILYPFFVAYYFWCMASMSVFCLAYPCLLYMCNNPARQEAKDTKSLRSLLKNREARRSIAITVIMYAIFNFCGINQVFSNPKIFYGEDNYNQHVICVLALSILCVGASSVIFKFLGLRAGLLGSAIIMTASCIAFFFSFKVQIFTYIFSAGYNLGFSHAPFYILGQIFPDDYRVAGTFLGMMVNRICATVSVIIPHGSPQDMHSLIFLFYPIAICISTAIVCWLYTRSRNTTEPQFITVDHQRVPQDEPVV